MEATTVLGRRLRGSQDGLEQEDRQPNKLVCISAPQHNIPNIAPSLSKAWFLLRMNRITASVFCAICGLSKYTTPADYYDHLKQRPHEGIESNDAMMHGCKYEDLNIRAFMHWSGLQVDECPYRTSPVYNWLGATPDGIILRDELCLRWSHLKLDALAPAPVDMTHPLFVESNGLPCILECKCPYFAMYDAPPVCYITQMFLQMYTYNVPQAYLSVWHPSGSMRIWKIWWNDAYWAWLMMRAIAFWECMRNSVRPGAELIPHVVHKADLYMKLTHDVLCPKKKAYNRRMIAEGRWWDAKIGGFDNAKADPCDPWMLPPDIDMRCLRYDTTTECAFEWMAKHNNEPIDVSVL